MCETPGLSYSRSKQSLNTFLDSGPKRSVYTPLTVLSSDSESHFLRVQLQLSNTHCLLLLGLLIALVLLGLDLKLTYLQKPMSPNVSVTQHL